MDLVDKKGISQIERTGLGFLFWGAMGNELAILYTLNGYNFSFLILGYNQIFKAGVLECWRIGVLKQ